MSRTPIAPTLAERVSTPEFAANVKRHAAKIDAEEQGWVVLDPKRARALEAVARLADRHTNPHIHCPACDPKLRAAVERLASVSGRGKRPARGSRREGSR